MFFERKFNAKRKMHIFLHDVIPAIIIYMKCPSRTNYYKYDNKSTFMIQFFIFILQLVCNIDLNYENAYKLCGPGYSK